MDNNMNLLEIADEYAKASSSITAADIFKKKEPDPKSEVKKEEVDLYEVANPPKGNGSLDFDPKLPDVTAITDGNGNITEIKDNPPKKKKKAWIPDASLLEDMPEMQSTGVVYDKKDLVLDRDGKLYNIMDDKTVEQGTSKVQEMTRMNQNIDIAKKRRKIKYFHIPQGALQVEMTLAASDPDVKAAQTALDAIIDKIAYNYPSMIEFEKEEDSNVTKLDQVAKMAKEPKTETNKKDPEPIQPVEVDDTISDEITEVEEEPVIDELEPEIEETPISDHTKNEKIDEVNIVIDKTELPNITWTQEDIEKVRKSRIIQLDIIEKDDIEFGSIKNADDKMVDLVTQSYYRKNNDIEACLPASHYRATFSGLSYTEVLDLRTSQEINPTDSEKVKWDICFRHIHNQSIGPWEEYVIYRDPTSQEEIRVPTIKDVPKKIPSKNIHRVTKEEDFLRKTSFADLEFILWKILCATSMAQEIIQFTCPNKINGNKCNNVYEWVYSPAALLDESTINPAVLEEMAKTGQVSSKEEILKHYNDSLLCSQNYVRLPSSKFVILYGHASAYDYVTDIYPLVRSLSSRDNINNPLSISKMLRYLALGCIREILVPNKNNNGYIRFTGGNNIVKILDTLNEFDWQTINEISSMIMNPYHFTYVMKDIVCPKCGHKEDVVIDTIVRLLFIVAQSLENVQVTLTKK